MKNKGSAIAWVIIIIAVLVIAGGIYFYSQPKQSSVVPTQNQVATSTATTSTNTTGWQTYTNSQYGFSLSIPTSWEAKGDRFDDLVSFNTITADISGESGSPNAKPYEILFDPGSKNYPVMNNIILGGISWSVTEDRSDPSVLVIYTTMHGNNVYNFYVHKGDEVTEEQILSSFKFTNK